MEHKYPPYTITDKMLNYVSEILMEMVEWQDYGKQLFYQNGKNFLNIC